MNVMLDLETLGTRPGCTILSIGAVEFNADGVLSETGFYMTINRKTCENVGLVEDYDTIQWWLKRPAGWDFLKQTMEGGAPLGVALMKFDEWFKAATGIAQTCIWSNGADFDLPILSEAFHRCGFMVPWKYSNTRCYRTLKNLYPDVTIEKANNHNALDDAKNQAEHASRILRKLYND